MNRETGAALAIDCQVDCLPCERNSAAVSKKIARVNISDTSSEICVCCGMYYTVRVSQVAGSVTVNCISRTHTKRACQASMHTEIPGRDNKTFFSFPLNTGPGMRANCMRKL